MPASVLWALGSRAISISKTRNWTAHFSLCEVELRTEFTWTQYKPIASSASLDRARQVPIRAEHLHGKQWSELSDSEFKQTVSLSNARIDGSIKIFDATFDGGPRPATSE